jgi:hypothetical protein
MVTREATTGVGPDRRIGHACQRRSPAKSSDFARTCVGSSRSAVRSRAHNPKVAGSNPAPATPEDPAKAGFSCARAVSTPGCVTTSSVQRFVGRGRRSLALALSRRGRRTRTSPRAAAVLAGFARQQRGKVWQVRIVAFVLSRRSGLGRDPGWVPRPLYERHIAPDMILGISAGRAQRRLHRLPAADGRGGLFAVRRPLGRYRLTLWKSRSVTRLQLAFPGAFPSGPGRIRASASAASGADGPPEPVRDEHREVPEAMS